MKQFDVLVIGGGHAGCEAAHAAARMGCNVALVTMSKDGFGRDVLQPCRSGVSGRGISSVKSMRLMDSWAGSQINPQFNFDY